MKLIRLRSGEALTIAIIHQLGRLEHLIDVNTSDELMRERVGRMVNAWNACDGISDKTLEALADGGGSSGTVAERITAWSLLVARARPSAARLIDEARKLLAKQGGVL